MSADGNRLYATPIPPPHAMESEQNVLGGVMLRNETWFTVSGILAEDDFYTLDHRTIWRAMAEMFAAGRPVDCTTLADHLRDRRLLADVGGLSYLGTLSADCPSVANIAAYAERVRETSKRRKLIMLAQDIAEAAYNGGDADDVMARCSTGVDALLRQQASTSLSFDQLASGAIDTFRDAADRKARGESQGATFGLPGLDHIAGGFHGPMLVVLAARPKCGKTALLNQFAMNAAKSGKPGLIVSLEMGGNQTAARALALHSGANVSRIQKGEAEDLAKARNSLPSLKGLPLWFDFSTWHLDAIVSQIALHKHRHGIAWAAVDHIGLVKVRERFGSRNDQIGHVSWTLKQTAKRLNLPIIALSQLSRECDRDGRKPRADDLRDSGNIEQDADMVLMLHVPLAERSQFVRRAKIGITANRNGPSLWVPNEYRFVGAVQTFYEEAPEAGNDARHYGSDFPSDPLSP